jgi:AraC family transcriptional regulator
MISLGSTPTPGAARPLGGTSHEASFWSHANAAWRQLAGSLPQQGFSFEWQEIQPTVAVNWAHSFHPGSVEICLNLEGTGWVASRDGRVELGPETVAFFVLDGGELKAQRSAGQRHQFLSVEYSVLFLRECLETHAAEFHPLIQRCLEGAARIAGCSAVSPLTHRHRDLLRSLLHPPVLASAQRLWYESKALEFAAEFFFSPGETEPLCTRAARLAAERVARAKTVLLQNLAEPLSLEELGRRVGCSHFYLSRTFTRETGLTISQWLRIARLERGAELLRAGNCNVTEAAMAVGYSSPSHFSHAFREVFGCCPGLYPIRAQTRGPKKS